MTDSSANPRNYGERPAHEDDPLMELSRIMDFSAPADENALWHERRSDDYDNPDNGTAHDEFAVDLERELLGDFGDYVQPVGGSVDGDHSAGRNAYSEEAGEPREEDFALALEEELDLHLDADKQVAAPEILEFEDVDRSEPVPQFDYSDYSQARDSTEDHFEDHFAAVEPLHSQLDDGAGREDVDPTVYQPAIEPQEDTHFASPVDNQDWAAPLAHAPEEAYPAEPVQSPLSLEDELENLLFGDGSQIGAPTDVYAHEVEPGTAYQPHPAPAYEETPQTVASAVEQDYAPHTDAPAYPYYTRSNFAPEGSGQENTVGTPQDVAPVAYGAAQGVQDDAFALDDDFAFDIEETETRAEGTDDDLSALDEISFSDEDFGFEPSGDLSAPKANHGPEEDFFGEDDLDLGSELEAAPSLPSYAHAVREDDAPNTASSFSHDTNPPAAVSAPAPEVETLSVAENKVEQTHSLDLPEVDYGDEEANSGLSDLEAEFAEVFNTIGVEETGAKPDAQSEADKAFEDIFRESASTYMPSAGTVAGAALGLGVAGAAASYGRPSSAPAQQATQAGVAGSEDDFYNHWAAQGAQTIEGGDYGARATMQPEDDLGSAAEAYRNRPVRGRRGLILASAAGIAVLLGGIGYHFLGGSGSDEPIVIRADNQPTKIQPENPGGATVPNQDKAVYDRVAGTLPNSPEQKSLISSGEEPVDISGTDDSENAASNIPDEPAGTNAAGQGQSAQMASDQNAPLIQPREVETMIVRPDGTIVQPEPVAAPQPAPVASQQPTAPSGGDEIAALASAGDTAPQPVAPAPGVEPAQAETPRLPVRAPVVPSRPAEQPVNIVGNVPQRTATPAAAAPQVASAAGGGYFIQIASQPSAELAQKSYANMAQRYANVIGGRGVDIKRAEIPGKGTYYRVRVQAGSKEDASALCGRLKSAGGNCLVTR
ncbi:SPOR domain-containing protein [Ochrobactrum sp. CM-21-5]|nr:SPOR domain-containing protein [Ochrobactrum sp. CM-21-5]MBC2885008.1 SPOR domain-containing protein [Ochrobactrum sp. CM-21-5]